MSWTRCTAGCRRASEIRSASSARISPRILPKLSSPSTGAGSPPASRAASRAALRARSRAARASRSSCSSVAIRSATDGCAASLRRRSAPHFVVGRLDLLESSRRLRRTPVSVGMVQLYHLPVRVVQLLGRGAGRDPEHAIRVTAHQSAASSSADMPSRPRVLRVRTPSARKSRASTTCVIVMTESITGVGTSRRAARSARKIRE